MAVTLTGRLADITGQPVENITNVTVKAPKWNARNSLSSVTTTQPQRVTYDRSGKFTLTVEEGLGWMYLDGDGWSDSIPFVAKSGMTSFVEAVLNATEWAVPFPLVTTGLDNIQAALTKALNAIASASATGTASIPAGTDWDTLISHGTYLRPSASSTDVNAPNTAIGVLYVSEPRKGLSSDGFQSQIFMGHADTGIWFRARGSNGKWTLWRRVDAKPETVTDWLKSSERALPPQTDLDTVNDAGAYGLVAGGYKYENTPYPDPVGTLYVGESNNTTGNIQSQLLIGTNPARVYVRDRNSAGYWQSWRQLGYNDVTHIDPGAGRRAAVVDAGLRRRGGAIGTGGIAAVALRFDHHLDSFDQKILPILRELHLPWGQMINAGNMGKGDDNWSWGRLAQECHNTGGEVWNHSWSHSDITIAPVANREITRGLSDLQENLPSLVVDGFAGPGQPRLMGMEGSEKPERFYDTYPGRLVLAQHAFVRGYYPGLMQPLNGPNLVGALHTTIDRLDFNYVRGLVADAEATKSGLTLMLHPNYMDMSGYMSTADLRKALELIASERDAGRLMVLSCTGVLMADSDRPVAHNNLLVRADGARVNDSWSQTVPAREAQGRYGVPHEAHVWVRAESSGTVKLSVQVEGKTASPTGEHTVTLTKGRAARLTVVVTPPLDTTRQVVTLTGDVTHTGIVYRPI